MILYARPPFDPEAAGLPRETLRVLLGLVVVLGATLGFVVTCGVVGIVDRFVPVSWFLFTSGVVTALIVVLAIAASALGWISWTLLRRGYPRRRLLGIGGAGWAAGLLCLLAIVRADTASEERRADAFCEIVRARGGAQVGSESAVDACTTAFLRCRRELRRRRGYSELTQDAEREQMNACLNRSPSAPR